MTTIGWQLVDQEHVPRRGSHLVLGTGREARQRVGPALPAERLRRHGEPTPLDAHLTDHDEHVFADCPPLFSLGSVGRAGSGSRLDCAASSMAQRIVLCRNPLDLPLWLHLSVRLALRHAVSASPMSFRD